MDRKTYAKIIEKITLTDDETLPGKVNINTAGRAVLSALLDGNSQKAQAIIDHRSSLSNGFMKITDLLNVQSFTVKDFKKMADFVTTRSNVFAVETIVTSAKTGSTYRGDAIVNRGSPAPEILYWHEGAAH